MTFSLSPWDTGSLSRIFRGGQIYLFFFPLLRGAENVYYLVRGKKKRPGYSPPGLLLTCFSCLLKSYPKAFTVWVKMKSFFSLFNHFFTFLRKQMLELIINIKYTFFLFFWALALNWLFFCGLNFCWIHSFFILYVSLHLFIHFWPLQTSGSLRT